MNDEYVTKAVCTAMHDQTKSEFVGVCERLDVLNGKIEALSCRLYKDNGTISIQTRLDRHDRVIRVVTWLVATSSAAMIVLFVGFAAKMVYKLISLGVIKL